MVIYNDRAYLDVNVDEHFHFVCEKCSAVIDLDEEVEFNSNPPENFKANKFIGTYYGICDKCLKKEGRFMLEDKIEQVLKNSSIRSFFRIESINGLGDL